MLTLRREPSLRLKHEALGFQREAVRAIRDLEFGAVFHEQGLGKTKIAIDVLTYWLRNQLVDTVMIVAKKSLLRNWEDELAVHTELRPSKITNDRSKNYYVFNSPARLVLTHYEAVRSEQTRFGLFLRTREVAVILDESTKIKNPNAALTGTFMSLAPLFKKRVIMTGTPVANRPYDIWSQVFFLDQGASLGADFLEFKRATDLPNRSTVSSEARSEFEGALQSISEAISPFSVRETKSDGVITLPDKVIHSIVCEWEPRQLDLYRQVREEERMIVFAAGRPVLDDAEVVLKRLLRLIQISSYPQLVDDSYDADPGKVTELVNLLTTIRRKDEKAIVWTSFIGTSNWLRSRLADFNPVRVNGTMDMDSRHRVIERFRNDASVGVLVATTGAAKEGLTLTVANHAIFYDRNFSLDDYLQAQDRIHRISQGRPCHVYKLIMRDSIDEWVEVLLEAKHAAAGLSQGDLDVETYDRVMNYDFAEMLRKVLGNEGAYR